MVVAFLIASSSCAGQKPQPSPSPEPTGGTTLMPASFYTSYYSTQKARALGETYDKNLEHLLTQLTQSSIGKLQFANAIVALSVGFFTHAASQPPDERYLEAIIGMPDILDEEKDFSTLVGQLFSQYGHDVLSTLVQDEAIARDGKIAGYGIHFSWRSLTKTPSGPHLTMREAVLYFAKDQVAQFLGQQLSQDAFLSRATLFARRGEQPAEQVQYLLAIRQPQSPSLPREEDRDAAPPPAPAEQEPIQEPQAESSLGTEVHNTTPPLIESRAPKRQKNVRVSKRKRRSKRRLPHRPVYRSATSVAPLVTIAPQVAVLPNQQERINHH